MVRFRDPCPRSIELISLVHRILQTIPPIKRSKSASPSSAGEFTLIDQLLAEQKKLLTPVAEFSGTHHTGRSDLEDHYRSLIPLSKPGPGEQYAFEVSLDRCTGCKACVSACHSLNGLDEHETWRDIGVIHSKGWQQTITTACHHCADPGCLGGCPVGAYEKEKDTGIVRHLDDQCIGCSYCILKCPYDVPKYSKKRGIVRKCDMCHQRLTEGEAPACVQACPTEAIRIVKVSSADLVLSSSDIDSPILGDPGITRPSTRYIGRPVPATALAADRDDLQPQHAHWPLVMMLTLTQAGIGLLFGALLSDASSPSANVLIAANVLFMAGMASSVLHLGQPLKAWRFFIGLRTSWLSREILSFSLFAPIPLALLLLSCLPDFPFKPQLQAFVAISSVPLALIAVFTSVMIYHDTKRRSWRLPLTAARFFGTTANLTALGAAIAAPSPLHSIIFGIAVLLKMIPEARILRKNDDPDATWSPDIQSARLQGGPLVKILNARMILAFIAIFVAFVQPWFALALLLASEILERQLFFQSVHAPKMPGGFGPGHSH